MTKKRFTVDDDEDIWEDDYFLAVAHNHNNAMKIAKRLNKLAYGNRQLKKQLSDDFNQSKYITVQKSIICDLKKENKQLKQLLLQFYTEDEINAEMI